VFITGMLYCVYVIGRCGVRRKAVNMLYKVSGTEVDVP
jgi:hypothetical protein